MKIALYRNIEYKFDAVMEATTGDIAKSYARISEYIDVTFTMLDEPDTQEILAIKKLIAETEEKNEKKLRDLRERLDELYKK